MGSIENQNHHSQAAQRTVGAPAPHRDIASNSSAYDDYRSEANMITASQLTGSIPSAEYSWLAPSPPSIHVPQVPDDKAFFLPTYNGMGYELQGDDREILNIVANKHRSTVGVRDWKYEWRRQAQQILSFLYLGPSSSARDQDTLKLQGVTMLLVIRDTMTAQARLLSGDKVAAALSIESCAIDVAGNAELIAAFPRAVKAINDHLIAVYRYNMASGTIEPDLSPAKPGKVMVFCESGNERSAVVVAAYLMYMYELSLVEAVQYIQSQRFCVAFDDGLKNLLRSYSDFLDAQRFVSRSVPIGHSNTPTKPVKRSRDEMDGVDMSGDADIAMDSETVRGRGDDVARFSSRTHFAPFHD